MSDMIGTSLGRGAAVKWGPQRNGHQCGYDLSIFANARSIVNAQAAISGSSFRIESVLSTSVIPLFFLPPAMPALGF